MVRRILPKIFAVAPSFTNWFLNEAVQLRMIGDAHILGIVFDSFAAPDSQSSQQDHFRQRGSGRFLH